MDIPQHLVEKEREVQACQRRLAEIEEGNWFLKQLLIGRRRNQLKGLNEIQFYAITDYLLETDQSFLDIVHQNYELLENREIRFSVYASQKSLFSASADRVEGTIHPNGYGYYYTVKQGIESSTGGSWYP